MCNTSWRGETARRGRYATLQMCSAKTDRECTGETVWNPRETIDQVRAWLLAGEISRGQLFRSVGAGARRRRTKCAAAAVAFSLSGSRHAKWTT